MSDFTELPEVTQAAELNASLLGVSNWDPTATFS